MLGPRVSAERRVELELGGREGMGGKTFSFLDARCTDARSKKHMLAVAWATWGGSFAPWGAAAPQTPPLVPGGAPVNPYPQAKRPHRLPKRRQSAAHCSTNNVAERVKLFYQAGDISHQPPTP